jgi:hypothetical protein
MEGGSTANGEVQDEGEENPDEMVVEDWEEWEDPDESPDIFKVKDEYPDTEKEVEDDDEEWDDGDDEEIEDTRSTCDICGVRIYSWMKEAHSRYHGSI